MHINPNLLPNLLGSEDKILRKLNEAVRSNVVARGDEIIVDGPPEEETQIRAVFKDLVGIASRDIVDEKGLSTALNLVGISPIARHQSAASPNGRLVFERSGYRVLTKSRNQAEYVNAMEEADLVFTVGPAGTGKTYLAVAQAVRAFLASEFERIILVRPVVEAGENLGYLPGDLQEKVEPYFRPLYDALLEMLQHEKLKRCMDLNQIEVAPLAYMRGRTLSRAFVILDEAQNTTGDQLKMFLTRLGPGTKAVVTGDLTQIDLPVKSKSGLPEALRLLQDIKGIRFITLSETDVVRHALVRDIILAYERDAAQRIEK
ncbi:PhoH family protein [bacterium]|nr:PhoH family protein [bacterium]